MKYWGALALRVGDVVVLRLRGTMPAVLVAAVVALAAGCSWIQPSNRVLAEQGQPTSPSAGTSSSASAPAPPAQPAWAAALGIGVVVMAPTAATASHDSPGAAVRGLAHAMSTGTLVHTCAYYPPSDRASCQAIMAQFPVGTRAASIRDFALGYVAIDGNEALVGVTGTFCMPSAKPACASNHNPAAIFSEAKPFRELWAESVAADVSTTTQSYSLAPCVKVGNRWYNYYPLPGGNT